MAEKRQPWAKWYWGDWRKDARLRRCSYAARGLWADMLSLMGGECDRFGFLMMEGQALTAADLVGLLGGAMREVTKLLAELSDKRVYSRTGDPDLEPDLQAIIPTDIPVGVIFSRRMVRDKAKAEADIANGKTGGNPRLKPQDNGGVNPPDKAQKLEARSQESEAAVVAAISQTTSDELNRLNRVLGFDPSNFTAHAANIRTLVELKADGCDFEKHILPAAEQAAKGGKGKSLAYIRPRAIELRDAAKLVASMPAPFENTDEAGWRSHLRTFRDKGLWSSKWGPKPGEEGCKCPPWILKEQQQETAHAAE